MSVLNDDVTHSPKSIHKTVNSIRRGNSRSSVWACVDKNKQTERWFTGFHWHHPYSSSLPLPPLLHCSSFCSTLISRIHVVMFYTAFYQYLFLLISLSFYTSSTFVFLSPPLFFKFLVCPPLPHTSPFFFQLGFCPRVSSYYFTPSLAPPFFLFPSLDTQFQGQRKGMFEGSWHNVQPCSDWTDCSCVSIFNVTLKHRCMMGNVIYY